jgi:hypothetical protein
MPHHQIRSSTFEFLHTYCYKSMSKAYRGESVYMLRSSSPLCGQFLHLFPMFVFGIINFLLGGSEIYQVVCFQATS